MPHPLSYPPESSLAHGWNTWNTRSVLSHVLMPQALGISLSLHHPGMLASVTDAVFGIREQRATAGVRLAPAGIPVKRVWLKPGPHAYDASYTAATVVLGEVHILVESAVMDGNLVIMVTPSKADYQPPSLVVEAALLWHRRGHVEAVAESEYRAVFPDGGVCPMHCAGQPQENPNLAPRSPAWVFALTEKVGLSTGVKRSLGEIEALIGRARSAETATHVRYGALAALHGIGQACVAWGTIYDPAHRRVIATVSRAWNMARFGYGVFCWDTFFLGWLMAPDHPALARNNLREVFREMIDDEFVPNVANGSGRRSWDRSQPPVGSLAVLAVHEIAPDRAFLAEVWPALLTWNRWWHAKRRNADGLLSWGSHPVKPRVGDLAEIIQPNTTYGASLESGMDNSPMYDEVPFDAATHLMALSDVGLNSLYVTDCEALGKIARELGRTAEAEELAARGRDYAGALRGLWHAPAGIYLNRRTDTRESNPRLSPTLFYPLLAGVATAAEAEAMVTQHLLNEREFWGEWVLPSISRNDPAFADQNYWRGRVWAPLNFLVYLGLKRAGFDQPAAELAQRSRRLLERNWEQRGGMFENYSAISGEGGEVVLCDPMYPWTGLFVLMNLMESGHVPLPSICGGTRAAC